MSFINLEQLPFVGMSYEFVGETQGAPFSAYIVKAGPGQGPSLHKHPYVEVVFTLEGRATITVGDEQREVKPGASCSPHSLSRRACSDRLSRDLKLRGRLAAGAPWSRTNVTHPKRPCSAARS